MATQENLYAPEETHDVMTGSRQFILSQTSTMAQYTLILTLKNGSPRPNAPRPRDDIG